MESYLALDVRALQRQGYLTAGRAQVVVWRNGAGEERGSLCGTAYEDRLELSYQVGTAGGGWEPVAYAVGLTWTACHFGGCRPWFCCPGVVNDRACGRRVAILYGGRYFVCRDCQRLAYESQQSGVADRARIKVQKLRRRLGGSASLIAPQPASPKGMHVRTYRRRIQDLQEAELACWVALLEELGRQDARLARRMGPLGQGDS